MVKSVSPVRMVVGPTVERMVLSPLVMVLTTGAVTDDWGRPVAPGTPPTPTRVVSPVAVKMDSPLVTTVVKVEVETGLGTTVWPPPVPTEGAIVVSPMRVEKVLPPEVMTEKTLETIGEATTVSVPVGLVTVASGVAVMATPASGIKLVCVP